MEIEVTVTNKLGLHARPAALIAQLAAKFQSELEIFPISGGDPVDGRSLLGLLTLAAGQGSKLRLRAEGTDAAELLSALEALFKDGFSE